MGRPRKIKQDSESVKSNATLCGSDVSQTESSDDPDLEPEVMRDSFCLFDLTPITTDPDHCWVVFVGESTLYRAYLPMNPYSRKQRIMSIMEQYEDDGDLLDAIITYRKRHPELK